MSEIVLPVRGYKFLQDDLRSGAGSQPPWQIGEVRTITGGAIVICQRGYHYSPTWYDALKYAPGSLAATVECSKPTDTQTDKAVSRSMRVVATANVEQALRLWGCDCAERALLRERERGREPDPRCWTAIEVARRYVCGEATREELAAAWAAAGAAAGDAARAAAGAAARAAAWAAAWDAAWDAARDAALAAARDAARAAARDAEILWQRARLEEMIGAVFASQAVTT